MQQSVDLLDVTYLYMKSMRPPLCYFTICGHAFCTRKVAFQEWTPLVNVKLHYV